MNCKVHLPLALAALALAGCDPETVIEAVPALAVSRAVVETRAPLGNNPAGEQVTIVNGTDGTLSGLSASVEYTTGQGWLAATLDRTTATREQAATLRLQASSTGLAIGVYRAVVLLRADGAGNSPFRVRVEFTVQPRPPARVELLSAFPGQIANGAPLGPITVRLVNVLGEPTPVAGVVVTATLGGDGVLSGAQAVQTDASGQATFADLVITGPVGAKTVSLGSPELVPATGQVVLVAGAAARIDAASVVVQSAPAGTEVPSPPVVAVQDQSGNPVAGVAVSFVPTPGSTVVPAAPIVSGADGLARLVSWRLRDLAGPNAVTATAAGLAGSPLTFTATGEVGPAAVLTKHSGDNLIGLVGTTLATPHVARVTDAVGNGVAGVTVSWTVTGGGSVAPAAATTDGDGFARASRTLGPAAGPVMTTASAPVAGGLAAVTFNITAANAGPAQIVKVSGDGQTATVNTTLTAPLVVRVLDAVGGVVAGVTVTFTTAGGGSFPSGQSVQTNAAGTASATWRLGTGAGAQTAQAAVGGPAPALFTATATAGPISAVRSLLAVSPATITAGGGPSVVTVTARDAFDNPVAGAAVTLAATGTGALTQPATLTGANGVATGAYASNQAGIKTVTADAGGVPLASAAGITVNPGPPAVATGATATAFPVRFGQLVTPAPAVAVADAFGNPIPSIPVTFAVTQGSSAITPLGGTVVTNAAGAATVGSWFVQPSTTAPNVSNRLQATVAGGGIAGNPVIFTGTADVRYTPDISGIIGATCSAGGCHGGIAPSLTYAFLVNGTNYFVAYLPPDSTTRTATYNRLLAKTTGVTVHSGGTFPANVITVFAAWIRQGVKPN